MTGKMTGKLTGNSDRQPDWPAQCANFPAKGLGTTGYFLQ